MKNWMEFLELSVMWKLSMKMLKMTMTNIRFHKSTKKTKKSTNPRKNKFFVYKIGKLQPYLLSTLPSAHEKTKKNPPIHEKTNFLFTRLE